MIEWSETMFRNTRGKGIPWVRQTKMFFETIERDGKTMRRFEPTEGKL